MKRYIYLLGMSLFFCNNICGQGGFNPNNPPEPNALYNLVLQVSPDNAGSGSCGNGYFNGGRYTAGHELIIEAYPYSGYRFVSWKEDENVRSDNWQFSYTMPARNVTLTAVFEYDPENPDDPDEPLVHGVVASNQSGDAGQTIYFPVHLLNHGINAHSVQFDIIFPDGITVNHNGAELTNRKSDHIIAVTPKENNEFRFSITSGTNASFSGSNGILLQIPVTFLAQWLPGETYPVRIENVQIGTPGGPVSSQGKAGSLTINYSYFLIPAGASRNVSGYTTGDIVFESNDALGTGELAGISHDPAQGFQVTGKVKLVKEFTVDQWYPLGFPFEIESVTIKQGENTWDGEIYNEDTGNINHDHIDNAGDDNYFVKYYNGNDNYFHFTDKFEVNKGYIVQFPIVPYDAGKVEVTFTSVANPVIHSTSGTVDDYHSSNYTLSVNPNVAHTGSLDGAVHYYQYNYGRNYFGKVNDLSSQLKPFEATVVYDGTAMVGYVSRVIGAGGETTGIKPAVNDRTVRTEYYDLMGVRIAEGLHARSLPNGIYIVKRIYESGKTSTVKQIIKK